ncbi:MAG: trypsin-like peptidase domain-containing protein [Burkholderiaceae bacterium]
MKASSIRCSGPAARATPAVAIIASSMVALMLASTTRDVRAEPLSAATVFASAGTYTVQVRSVVSQPFGQEDTGVRMGAGFVVDAKRGWVLTNAHVVARSPSRVAVSFQGEPFAPATKRYVDPLMDLAVVDIGRSLPPEREATLDCGGAPEIGHPVGAYGHPRGQKYTGTRGILSRVARNLGGEMLQIDAAINGGNSGGPLLSLETGHVLGVNTSKLSGSQGLNFALPAAHACRILAMLRDGVEPLPPELPVSFFEDTDDRGVLKVAKAYGRAADGFLPGDIVLGLNPDKPVADEKSLLHSLRGMSRFTVFVRRAGEVVPVTVATRLARAPTQATGLAFGGLVVSEWTTDTGTVVAVDHVHRGSDAQAQSYKYRDVLLSVDGKPVDSLASLRTQLGRRGGRVAVVVLRGWYLPPSMRRYYEKTLEYEPVRVVGAPPRSSGKQAVREPVRPRVSG